MIIFLWGKGWCLYIFKVLGRIDIDVKWLFSCFLRIDKDDDWESDSDKVYLVNKEVREGE